MTGGPDRSNHILEQLCRRDLDEDPPRLVDLPFAFSVADAFFACSSAAVFSLAMVAGETREERLGGGVGIAGEKARHRGA